MSNEQAVNIYQSKGSAPTLIAQTVKTKKFRNLDPPANNQAANGHKSIATAPKSNDMIIQTIRSITVHLKRLLSKLDAG